MKKSDEWIKERVQAVERSLPGELEDRVAAGLSRAGWEPRSRSVAPPYRLPRRWTIAAAATLCALLIVFITNVKRTGRTGRENQVMVLKAEVGGAPAQTYVFPSEDPDMRIIWFERIHLKRRP